MAAPMIQDFKICLPKVAGNTGNKKAGQEGDRLPKYRLGIEPTGTRFLWFRIGYMHCLPNLV
jgi:hypothetical protein